ncbi:MAG: hypothetical protein SFZ24_09550 [Planctomycetota bacterium]|nr:hypothetical protein [Planctomycetota bacterium]
MRNAARKQPGTDPFREAQRFARDHKGILAAAALASVAVLGFGRTLRIARRALVLGTLARRLVR